MKLSEFQTERPSRDCVRPPPIPIHAPLPRQPMNQLLQFLKNPTVRYVLKALAFVAAAAAGKYGTAHPLEFGEATAVCALASLATVQGLTVVDVQKAAMKAGGNLCAGAAAALLATHPEYSFYLGSIGAWLMSATAPAPGTAATLDAAVKAASIPPARA
ncbi:MAG TPA: hypothetical protein VHM19_08890 [Polyangiales bacterium]|jgi:hypothetical protein|nr:hypothetical protein [Polyangiales bacterium]